MPYKWNAKDYADHSQEQQKWARELIHKLDLKGTESVLDIGCGDGKVTAELACSAVNGMVVGVDSSQDMIQLARTSYPQFQHPNLSFERMDAGRLIFDDVFDVALSNAALHWIQDHRPVLKGIFHSLKKEGKILLQMGGKGNASDILTVLEHVMSTPIWRPYFSAFRFPYYFPDAEEYRLLLSQCDFVCDRVELVSKVMAFDSDAGLKGWLRTTWLPYTQQVPDEKREDFITNICDRYVDQYQKDSQGVIQVGMVRLEVAARKKT